MNSEGFILSSEFCLLNSFFLLFFDYSTLSATIGSTFAARLAGR
jgi:hypothetical protein